MTTNITQSVQFVIERLTLEVNNKNYNLDGMFTELNLYDNLFMPCVSGSILLLDALGLSDQLKFKGNEKIRITISKDGGEDFRYDKEFVVYSLTNKQNYNVSSVGYILNFVSEEFILSLQKKISQSYTGDYYSNIAYNILLEYLNVSDASPSEGKGGIGIIYPSDGVQSLIFPTLSPFDAINFVSQKAVWKNPKGSDYIPDFLFFETAQLGYNFVPLQYLLDRDPVFNINFKPKNLRNDSKANLEEFLGARDLKVLSQFSVLETIRDGVYAGKFIGFDTLTKTQKITTIKNVYEYTASNKKSSFANLALDVENKDRKTYDEMDESRIVSYPFASPRATVDYIIESDLLAESYAGDNISSNIDNTEQYIFQRKAIFTNLMQRRLQLVMPGNFALFSSRMINLRVPRFSAAIGTESLDKSLSGKYIITGTRHVIKPDRHETIIEVSTDKIEV